MRLRFGAKDKFEFNPMLDDVRLVYEFRRNVFNGNVSLQLHIYHRDNVKDKIRSNLRQFFCF